MIRYSQQKKRKLNRSNINVRRRWEHHEEIALIEYLKNNLGFEKPYARIYYSKFLFEYGIDIDWRLVRCKIHNMRITYRKAKDYEAQQMVSNNCNIEDLKRNVLKICWYSDDFDVIFPMCNNNSGFSDAIIDEELSKDENFYNTDSLIAGQQNIFNIKQEKQEEDASIKEQNTVQEKLNQPNTLKEIQCKNPVRNRKNPVRKWQRNEEKVLIAFLKNNREIEKPTARNYYTKFIQESGIDIEWHLVRCKVRNMRAAYRKAKEHESKEMGSNNCNLQLLRNIVLKICWFVDEFDTLYPNDMNNSICLSAYRTPDPIIDDEVSKDEETFFNMENKSRNFTIDFLPEEESIARSSSNSLDEDMMTMSNVERQSRDEILILRQKEFDLARKKLNFEKEKFCQEIRLKEKEIDSEEKLRVMEIQMKERIALKKLEIEEMLALRAAERPDNSYNSIYHNLV